MGMEISTYYNLLEPLGHVCKHLALPFYEKKMKLREKISLGQVLRTRN